MPCPTCGVENPPSAQYCSNCGHEFVREGVPEQSPPALPQGTLCPKCKLFNPAPNQFCGKCGAAMHKKTSPVLIGCLGLIGFVVFSSVVISVVGGDSHKSSNPSSSTLSSSSPSSSSPSASTVPEYSRPQTKAEPGSQWTYHDLDDTMGRKKSIAFVISTNTLDFGFPYKG